MAETTAGGPGGWRGIDELAELVGAYCWVERRIFELAGGWAVGPGGTDEGDEGAAELRVFWAAASRRHGALAGRWAERLPVRAGVDAAGLVSAPDGPLAGALEALGSEPGGWARAEGLVGAVLPRLAAVYEAHLRTASPVSEGPVMEDLVAALRAAAAEIRGGRALLEALPGRSEAAGMLRAELQQAFERTNVFPAVRPS